jgi:acyl-coenzyme A thioesterase PaaI-like protein
MRHHILQELNFAVREAGDELHGTAEVTPYMHAPGTAHLRTSILASWADMLSGLLAAQVMGPRVPVTLELDVHLYRPAPTAGTLRAVGRPVKKGRSVFVGSVEFSTADGEPVGFSASSFMAAPDTTLRMPSVTSLDAMPAAPALAVPLADRAGCKRQEPGVAVLPRSEDGLNSSNTVNGGLIALAVEEALLSLAPGETLCSLALRYMQAVRVGPAVATATMTAGLGQAELRDAGNGNRLSVTATARTFGG